MLIFIIGVSTLIRVPDEYQLQLFDSPVVERKTERGFEIVVDSDILNERLSRNEYEIIILDLEEYFRSRASSYPTLQEVIDSVYSFALNYPLIVKLDTIGPLTYEGRRILALKISDNVNINENEPKLLFEGMHHAREWPAIVMPLFIIDTLVTGYINDVPDIRQFVENLELWFIPIVNPDGYKYSHDDGHSLWRKNRRYFSISNSYGVDLNRNYWGYPDLASLGNWGSPHGASYNPSSNTYMGQFPLSESGVKAVFELRKKYNFIASLSYHSYSEIISWPLNFSYNLAKDSSLLEWVGTEMSKRISGQSGRTYTPMQGSSYYFTVGDENDFAYGYSLFKKGRATLPYTVELCESEFAPPESCLVQILHENFDGVYWLLENAYQISDSLKNRTQVICEFDSLSFFVPSDFTITWHEVCGMDDSFYVIRRLGNLLYGVDGAEEESELWIMNGFGRVDEGAYSGNYCYRSQSTSPSDYMRTRNPFPPPEEFKFWVKHEIASEYAFGYFEVSDDNRFWHIVRSYKGNSDGWIPNSLALRAFADSIFGDSLKPLFYRFRLCEYGNSEFFVDEIENLGFFGSDSIIDTVASTSYSFSDHPEGSFYLTVRGKNSRGWGDWCCPIEYYVIKKSVPFSKREFFLLSNTFNPFGQSRLIRYNLPQESQVEINVLDKVGRHLANVVSGKQKAGFYSVRWSGKDRQGKILPSGVYFLRMEAESYKVTNKIVIIR
jgi:carboxypeptidase T